MNTATQARPAVHIPMMPVESSQIAAIGHDAPTSTLAIQFKNKSGPGSVYHYQNFTADLFAAFAGAESIGSHFGKNIKPFVEKFPFEKIDPAAAAAAAPAPAPATPATATLVDLADAQDDGALFPTDGELVTEIRRLCAETFGMDQDETDARMAKLHYRRALCYMSEPLPGGQHYSKTTFKDNGEPILLTADGTRSVFCDLCDDE